ncbi:unnamed protein product, partial [Onchocerca ochengi]|uniref:Calponin-homology (CH) domain-containing protein n=1 Tax=Onchocerca ochengi TaxID=42157 RepID=A0A182EJS0_ONCOC
IANNKTSSNSLGLYGLSAYQQQHTTISTELYSDNCITSTTSSTNLYSSTVSSSSTQRPQAIVTPITATVTASEPVTVNQESETKSTEGNKEQNNGIIPDCKNNNTFDEEEQKLNNQYCIHCSTANSQRNINNSNKSINTSSNNTATSIDSNNFHNILDHQIIAMIDDSQSTINDSDLIDAQKIGNNYANDQTMSSFLTTADHSTIVSTQSPKCLSPVIEDSNSSGSSSYHILTTDSTVSMVASISSSAGNVNASEIIIHPSDNVSSSIAISHGSSPKNERILSSSKSATLTSRSSTSVQPLSNRTIIEKRNSMPTHTTNSRTNDSISSLTKSKSVINTTTRTSRTTLHRSSTNPTTVSGTSSNVTSGGIIENMRKILENRLNITLPSGRLQLAASLADGVTLCNFANRIRLRAINSLFTPVSKELPLSPPKCRRNVDSFLAACRRIGVPEKFASF